MDNLLKWLSAAAAVATVLAFLITYVPRIAMIATFFDIVAQGPVAWFLLLVTIGLSAKALQVHLHQRRLKRRAAVRRRFERSFRRAERLERLEESLNEVRREAGLPPVPPSPYDEP